MNEFLTDGDMVGSSVVGLSVGSSEGFCVGDFCEAMLKMEIQFPVRKRYKSHLISIYLLLLTVGLSVGETVGLLVGDLVGLTVVGASVVGVSYIV